MPALFTISQQAGKWARYHEKEAEMKGFLDSLRPHLRHIWMGVAVVARFDLSAVLHANRWGGTIGVTAACVLLAIAYFTGRDTIRDTQWAQLDVAD